MAIDTAPTRFLVVGLGNTLTGLAIIYAAQAAGAGEIVANATGYTVGLALSFVLNRRWTFRHRGALFSALLRFAAVLAVAYVANLAVVLGAIWGLGINSYIGQALGVPVYTVVSYIGSRWYAFPDQNEV